MGTTWSSQFSQTALNARYWTNLGANKFGLIYPWFNDFCSALDNGWLYPMNAGGQNLSNLGNVTLAAAKTISIPGQPRLYSAPVAAQSIPNAVFTPVAFTFDNVNIGGMHSTTVNPQTVTIQQAGLYLVSGCVTFVTNSSGIRSVQFLQVGSTILGQVTIPAVSGNITGVSAPTVIAQLAAGQQIQLLAYQNSGAALNTVAGEYCYLCAYQLA